MKKMKKRLPFLLLFTTFLSGAQEVTLSASYPNNTSDFIGTFQNINYYEGGFSALQVIPGTNGTEFWTITDRGVNIDGINANSSATPSTNYPTCKPTYDKIYAFPTYAPKIMRLKIIGNEVQILQVISIKRPNGTGATGLLNPTGFGSTATEIPSTNIVSNCADFDANTASKDIWGIDSEGLDVDAQGNFWICEEGGPTIWKVNANGVVLKRYTPYALTQPEDVAIDPAFAFRRNNRGFEGITITPNGKIYAIIQSPMYYKNVSGVAGSATLGNSTIHRILEINPTTGEQKMYAYVNDGAIGTTSDIRPRDQKIGDLKAINNEEFLVIEQAARGAQNVKKLYKINISNATPVLSGLAYANGTKTLEELDTQANLTANGIVPVTKTLHFDIHVAGWPTNVEKAEGIAIIDKNTIVINNDNDYGQSCPLEDGIAIASNQKCNLYLFKVSGSKELTNYIPNNNMATLSNTAFDIFKLDVFPNPASREVTISTENSFGKIIEVYSLTGNALMKKEIKNNLEILNIEGFEKGIYFIKIDSTIIQKFIKE